MSPLRFWLIGVVVGCGACLSGFYGSGTEGSGTGSSAAWADDAPQTPAETPAETPKSSAHSSDPQSSDPHSSDPHSSDAERADAERADARKSTGPKSTGQKFIRLERSAGGLPISLQTAIVELMATRPDEAGVTVDLVGAVHIGEKSYYEALNKAFEAYDAVLYEMVARPGATVPKGPQRGSHPVMIVQNAFKDMLGLEHQLEVIDYDKQNFVHADLSPEAFAKSMRDRRESLGDLLIRSLQSSLSKRDSSVQTPSASEIELLWALFDKRRAPVVKRVLAEQFENLDDLVNSIDGPNGSTLISERDKCALDELKRQIGAGKKRIAIFYGVAHLPDLRGRLIADFAMQPNGERWLTAWTMPEPPRKAAGKGKTRRARKVARPAEKQADG